MAGVAAGFEERFQIFLGAAGLGKDESFAGGARLSHLLKANFQGLQECLAFCVDTDGPRQSGKSLQHIDLVPQLRTVNLDRAAGVFVRRLIGWSGFRRGDRHRYLLRRSVAR